MNIHEAVIGIAFLLNAEGVPAAAPETAGYETMEACEADMESVTANFEKMKADAPFDQEIQEYHVETYCFEGSKLK